jgi:hypothetical protein
MEGVRSVTNQGGGYLAPFAASRQCQRLSVSGKTVSAAQQHIRAGADIQLRVLGSGLLQDGGCRLLLRQPDPAQKIGKAGVGAEVVECGISLEFIDMTASSRCLL